MINLKDKKLTLLLILTIVLFNPFHSNAQICEGNLGENIFESGDFGSGTANVILQDPQIAPGFQYTFNPPPNDGFYTITNNTAPWAGVFGSWLSIGDNSNDPNGYMMVVNASHSPGLFYEQQITGLCENTLYEFSADVFNLIATGANFITPNISFLINGTTFFTTGPISEDEQWRTYGFTFTTDPGQNSVTLSLRNNAPGGIGNDLAIDNITFRPCGPEALILPTTIANICEDGDPIALEATVVGDQYDTPAFQWQQSFDEGLTWQNIVGENENTYLHDQLSSGFYYYRYLLANGMGNLQNSKCRVVSNIKVVNVVPKFYMITDTICEGLIYAIGNSEYSTTGMYVDSLLSSLGCDSIINLDLTIMSEPNIDVDLQLNLPICSYSEDGSIVLNEIINGTPPYQVSLDSEALPFDQVFSNLGAADYNLFISDYFGCVYDEVVSLPSPPPFQLDLGEDVLVDLGQEAQVFALANQMISEYSWQPLELNNCQCFTPQWLPLQTTTVYFSAISEGNCTALDSVTVNVRDVREVYIPNVFSPNDDGVNDHFTIFGNIPNVQEIEKIQIFDRWGSLVYERNHFAPNDIAHSWDGTFNGQNLGEGVFVYLTSIRFIDGKLIPFEGSVSLLR